MNTLSGRRKKYRMQNPNIHITVSFHDMNSYRLFVLVKRFQFWFKKLIYTYMKNFFIKFWNEWRFNSILDGFDSRKNSLSALQPRISTWPRPLLLPRLRLLYSRDILPYRIHLCELPRTRSRPNYAETSEDMYRLVITIISANEM